MKIRKCLVVLLLLVLIQTVSFGFDFSVGFKAGIGLPFMSGKKSIDFFDLENLESKIMLSFPNGELPLFFNFTAGGFLSFGIIDLFAIQPEILYTMSGMAFGDENRRILVHIYLIEAPVLAKLRLRTSGGGVFSIFAGPEVMYLVGTPVFEFLDANGEVTGTFDADYNDFPNNFALGIVGGVAVTFPNGGFLEVRDSIMLTQPGEITDWKDITWEATLSDFNLKGTYLHNFQIVLGFSF